MFWSCSSPIFLVLLFFFFLLISDIWNFLPYNSDFSPQNYIYPSFWCECHCKLFLVLFKHKPEESFLVFHPFYWRIECQVTSWWLALVSTGSRLYLTASLGKGRSRLSTFSPNRKYTLNWNRFHHSSCVAQKFHHCQPRLFIKISDNFFKDQNKWKNRLPEVDNSSWLTTQLQYTSSITVQRRSLKSPETFPV